MPEWTNILMQSVGVDDVIQCDFWVGVEGWCREQCYTEMAIKRENEEGARSKRKKKTISRSHVAQKK